MIRCYVFRVNTHDRLPPDRAYPFYGSLLSLLPADYGEAVHRQGETPVTQHLYEEDGETLWRVHLLDYTKDDAVSAVLDNLRALPLHTGALGVTLLESAIVTADDLAQAALEIGPQRYYSFRFLSPTAFRQAGRYVVLPDKELILQSLFNKWNAAFPSCPLEDKDVLRMLGEGIHISDYRLRTTRFSIKDTKIPGFTGELTMDIRLPAPVMRIWNLLAAFLEYSGVGIKTALGMGGVKRA